MLIVDRFACPIHIDWTCETRGLVQRRIPLTLYGKPRSFVSCVHGPGEKTNVWRLDWLINETSLFFRGFFLGEG